MVRDMLVDMAIKSEMFKKSSKEDWYRHLDYCIAHSQIKLIHHGSMVGFMTWYLTDDIFGGMYDSGKYLIVPFFYIEPSYRGMFNVRKLIMGVIRDNLWKYPEVEYILWKRYTRSNTYVGFKVGKEGGLSWVGAEQKQ